MGTASQGGTFSSQQRQKEANLDNLAQRLKKSQDKQQMLKKSQAKLGGQDDDDDRFDEIDEELEELIKFDMDIMKKFRFSVDC